MSLFESIKWSPLAYVNAAVVAREAANEMLSRLSFVTIQPAVILDAGCGVAETSIQLKALYPNAQVLALDRSEEMLAFGRAGALSNRVNLICGDSLHIPLPSQSVDLIFANFLLPWQADYSLQLKEWRRILRPEGLLVFTALGPDTLKEMHALAGLHMFPQLIDMHDLGDMLLQSGFADPIVDVDYTTLTYQCRHKLVDELSAAGVAQLPLMPPGEAVTFEVIQAHAWRPQQDKQKIGDDHSVSIPLSQLRSRLKG